MKKGKNMFNAILFQKEVNITNNFCLLFAFGLKELAKLI